MEVIGRRVRGVEDAGKGKVEDASVYCMRVVSTVEVVETFSVLIVSPMEVISSAKVAAG